MGGTCGGAEEAEEDEEDEDNEEEDNKRGAGEARRAGATASRKEKVSRNYVVSVNSG